MDSRPNRRIRTASALIDFFGGTNKVAEKYDVVPSAVSNWRRTGFPPRLHYRVFKDAQAAGIVLPARFFKQSEGAAA